MKATFEELVKACKEIAKATNIECEVNDFNQYGWKGISLVVDRFGGCAVNLCYLINEGKCFDWIHSNNETEIESISHLRAHAVKAICETKKVRLTEELHDFINSQY